MNGRIMDTPLGQGETKAKRMMEGRACEAEKGTGTFLSPDKHKRMAA